VSYISPPAHHHPSQSFAHPPPPPTTNTLTVEGKAFVRPTHPIDHSFAHSFIKVALPCCARVKYPKSPVPSCVIVSERVAINTSFAELFFIIIAVPSGYATSQEYAIMKFLSFASEAGCRIHLPLSVRMVV